MFGQLIFVVPAKAGTQEPAHVRSPWIPAFAGMTAADRERV
jgi:hypothetical protein